MIFVRGKTARGNKYHAEKIVTDGHKFPSKLEAQLYAMKKTELNLHLLKALKRQVNIKLTDAGILYIVDFQMEYPDGRIAYAEAKGFETAVWRIKRRLWKHYGPGPLEVWGGTYKNPFLREIIIPKRETK